MKFRSVLFVLLFPPIACFAQFPAPQEGSWVAPNFRFHTGEMLPELRLHYRTVGAPVLVLHDDPIRRGDARADLWW
jgi:hypothetical protein